MAHKHERPKSAYGEFCTLCNADAYHKVGEEQLEENPIQQFMHNMTAYICCACYSKLMQTKCEPKEA